MTNLDDNPGSEWSDFAAVELDQYDFDRDFYEAILVRNPSNVLVLRRLIEVVARCGRYGRALRLGLQLVELQPQDAIAYYNLACSYARLGQVTAGLDALEQALRLGYSDMAHLDADSDLDALRGDPRFEDVLAAV